MRTTQLVAIAAQQKKQSSSQFETKRVVEHSCFYLKCYYFQTLAFGCWKGYRLLLYKKTLIFEHTQQFALKLIIYNKSAQRVEQTVFSVQKLWKTSESNNTVFIVFYIVRLA